MEQASGIDLIDGSPVRGGSALAGKARDALVRFHVRDITNRRFAGTSDSEWAALASLRGGPDGHFSINNHRGDWCEVQVRGGDRYIRHVLMVDGSPAAFTNIDVRI